MVLYTVNTSQGERLNIDIDSDKKVSAICVYIYGLIENTEYINMFDLTLRYDQTVLLHDKRFSEYNIPDRSKLSFIIRRRSIDIPSPGIYDSPSPIKLEKLANNYHHNAELLNLIDSVNIIKQELRDMRADINFLKSDVDSIKEHIRPNGELLETTVFGDMD